jgi:catechol 2,3-dioxygenase
MMDTSSHSEIDRIRAVTIGVTDLEQSLDFYTQHWGLQLVQQKEHAVWLRGTGPDHHILVIERAPAPCLISITWGVRDRDALFALYERLASLGVHTQEPPRQLGSPGAGWGFAFYDPEGRLHKVVSDREDLQLLTSDKTLPVKIAHVVINTADMKGMTDFLLHTLGFKLSDSTLKMSFFRCNSNHHSLALADFNSITLNHIAFEMTSWNDLMFAVGRMKLSGHPIEWGVGRHGPGDNVFSYFLDPNEIVVEYTAEVQQITDPHHVPGKPEQWVRPPQRMDQWGHANLPSDKIKKAMSGQGAKVI